MWAYVYKHVVEWIQSYKNLCVESSHNMCLSSAQVHISFSVYISYDPSPFLLLMDQLKCTGGQSKIFFTADGAENTDSRKKHVHYYITSNQLTAKNVKKILSLSPEIEHFSVNFVKKLVNFLLDFHTI